MTQAIRTHTSNGTKVLYDVDFDLGYLDRTHVFVYLDSDEPTTQLVYTWINDTQIQLQTAPADGNVFHIQRITPTTLINDFSDGAILREEELDKSFSQSLMIGEETEDAREAQEGVLEAIAARANVSEDNALVSEENAESSAASAEQSAIQAANSVAAIAPVILGDGIWGTDKTYTAYNQYLIYSGQAYSPLPSTTFPYPCTAAPDLAFVYPLSLTGKGVYTTVSEMILADDIQSLDTLTVKVNNSLSKAGGATYTAKTLSQAISDGDVIDELVNHTLQGGLVAIINIEDGTLNVEQAGVVLDWNEDTQTGTDSTLALQNAVNYAREHDLTLSSGSKMVRITGNIETNPTGIFKRFTWNSDNTTIVADFYGIPLTVSGGASIQTINGKLIVTCSNVNKKDDYDNSQNGIHIRNARHDLTVEVVDMPGSGVLIESTGGNLNNSRHNITTSGCGRGVEGMGSSNDVSVIRSTIRARSSRKEGIYMRSEFMFRQWTFWWYAENNWQEDDITTTNYAVRILNGIGIDGWIYSEQGNAAGEIFIDPASTGRVQSARNNKDVIYGEMQGYAGKELYQQNFVTRQAEPLVVRGYGPRFGENGELITVPFTATGGKRGELFSDFKGLGIRNFDDSLAFEANEGRGHNLDETVFAGQYNLTSTESSADIIVSNDIPKPFSTIGMLTVTGTTINSQSGQGSRVYKVPFSIIGGAISLGAALIDNEVGTPHFTAALSYIDNGELTLTISYNSATFGNNYYVTYRVDTNLYSV